MIYADGPARADAAADVVDDGLRALAARIVIGDDHLVGEACGNLAHDRSLAGVAIAAAAKHDPQPAATMCAGGAQRLRERIGRVGEIDERMRTLAKGLHASRRGGRARQRRGCSCERHLPGEQHRQHRQHVIGVEIPDERHLQSAASPARLDLQRQSRRACAHARGAYEGSAGRQRMSRAAARGDDEL